MPGAPHQPAQRGCAASVLIVPCRQLHLSQHGGRSKGTLPHEAEPKRRHAGHGRLARSLGRAVAEAQIEPPVERDVAQSPRLLGRHLLDMLGAVPLIAALLLKLRGKEREGGDARV